MIYFFLHIIFLAGVSRSVAQFNYLIEQQTSPAFEIDISPGEGRPVIHGVGKPIVLRVYPNDGALIMATVTAPANRQLTFDSARFQTTKPGLIKALAAGEIRGRNLGSIRHLSRDRYYSGEFRDTLISVSPSDTIVYLQDRAEGTCFIRIAGTVLDAELCPIHFPREFELLRAPEVLWWIYVRDGATSGWLLLNDSTAVVVDRTF